jgi:hypothetical protein
MSDCPGSDQSGTGMKKLTMPGPIRNWTEPTPSCIFFGPDRTEITDNADAGVSFVNADAQLWTFTVTKGLQISCIVWISFRFQVPGQNMGWVFPQYGPLEKRTLKFIGEQI